MTKGKVFTERGLCDFMAKNAKSVNTMQKQKCLMFTTKMETERITQ